MDNKATRSILFSHKLVADHGLENLYDLVRNGAWTLDVFNRMIREISRDLNGDGIMDVNDLYGHLTHASVAYYLFVGAGGRITTNNSENYPELVISDQRTPAIIDKILETMGDPGQRLFADDYLNQFSNPWDELTRPMFRNNQGLFYTVGMGTANLLRDAEMDFGILPHPKFDENQAGYHNPIQASNANAVKIPISVSNLELTGLALEAMAAESMYTLTEAYYTINFENKTVRDEDSIEMIKIILDSRSYDLGSMFNFGGFMDIFAPMTRTNVNNFASVYERSEARAQREIGRLIEAFANQG
jgi:hypothetical protein